VFVLGLNSRSGFRGQVLTRETIDFMRKLDVKEIHGYNAAEGLKLVHPDALAKLTTADRR
jgi:arginine decarboxylase